MAQVIKRGNSYLIRVSAGYSVDGKQIKKNLTWTPDPGMTLKQIEKELDRQDVLFEERVKTGRVIDGNIKFCDFANLWIKSHAENQLAPKTIFEYKALLPIIDQAIGHLRLDRLQPKSLIDFYTSLNETGARRDNRYHANKKLAELVTVSGKKAHQIAVQGNISDRTVYCALKDKSVSQQSALAISNALGAKLGDIFIPVDEGAKLSGNTILHYHRLISSILQTAVEWQVIISNPCSRVRPPKVEQKESLYLDEVQAKQLADVIQNEPIQRRVMILLLIYTGIRRGELHSLRWSDVDFDKGLLYIQRTTQYIPGQGIIEKAPKSAKSKRIIKISAIALRLLIEHRNAQNTARKACEAVWRDHELIFTRMDGSTLNPDELTKWFRKFNQAHNLPKVNLHSLRHTNATLMISAGTDIRTVSKRLGHAQTSTTMNIYSHAIKSADEAAAETIENIFEPMKTSAYHKAEAAKKI